MLVTPMKDHGISEMMQALGRRYVYYVIKTYQRTGTYGREDISRVWSIATIIC
jgi:hypothetical protein